MGSFFNALSGYLDQISQFIIEAVTYFNNLFRALKNSLIFVYNIVGKLPAIISAPIVIIIGIQIAKFIISLGKQ